jgi:SAM-dependent methyltransferase
VQPDEWLVQSLPTIDGAAAEPKQARRALDVACGTGQNAIWLAKHGYQVDAVDISPEALRLAELAAKSLDTRVRWLEVDLDNWIPESRAYDLVIVFRFLDRETIPQVVRTALSPGGWLIYETFASTQCARPDNHIHNPTFTLAPGELPRLFDGLEVVSHRETDVDNRSVGQLLARDAAAAALPQPSSEYI